MSDGRRHGPKVYELAIALGMSPRALIEIAHSLGISAQNRLTRIPPQSAAKLTQHCAAMSNKDNPENTV